MNQGARLRLDRDAIQTDADRGESRRHADQPGAHRGERSRDNIAHDAGRDHVGSQDADLQLDLIGLRLGQPSALGVVAFFLRARSALQVFDVGVCADRQIPRPVDGLRQGSAVDEVVDLRDREVQQLGDFVDVGFLGHGLGAGLAMRKLWVARWWPP